MDIQKENNLIQEAFEVEADEIGFSLDQKWGDYENPYENSDTALAFNLFKKGWQVAKAHEAKNLEGCVVVQPQGIILTCEEILEVLEFGAPDLKIKRTEYSEEQMSTEITIVHRETGHSGAGIYAYCTECPEEGAIKLGDVEAAKADTEGN